MASITLGLGFIRSLESEASPCSAQTQGSGAVWRIAVLFPSATHIRAANDRSHRCLETSSLLELINFIPSTVSLEHKRYKKRVSPRVPLVGRVLLFVGQDGEGYSLGYGNRAYLILSMKQLIGKHAAD